MTDIKIFVADDVNESGLEPLRAAGFDVEKRTGLKGAELAESVAGADGLVVRSETKVTAGLLELAGRRRDERARRQHDDDGRAHDGAAARARAPRPAGAGEPEGRAVGA